ncbi:hypothetical protein Glove_159g37 [Diversispora epigaea]|uniref:Uncharacterized protein n=1 Tax=Diversispora epigaea TaxID=1348612 RepID=A0A397IRJ4_9GLOM|nr:hypothetical protein Glove_159g37 [Diversispora epigaea]
MPPINKSNKIYIIFVNQKGQVKLGDYYHKGIGTTKDEEAFNGQVKLGDYYHKGIGTTKDEEAFNGT